MHMADVMRNAGETYRVAQIWWLQVLRLADVQVDNRG